MGSGRNPDLPIRLKTLQHIVFERCQQQAPNRSNVCLPDRWLGETRSVHSNLRESCQSISQPSKKFNSFRSNTRNCAVETWNIQRKCNVPPPTWRLPIFRNDGSWPQATEEDRRRDGIEGYPPDARPLRAPAPLPPHLLGQDDARCRGIVIDGRASRRALYCA